MSIKIEFQPMGRRVETEAGVDLLEAAQSAGVGLQAVCGGMGRCGQCLVQVEADAPVSPAGEAELSILNESELTAGMRLACQTRALGDLKVIVPARSLTAPQRIQVESRQQEVEFEPSVVVRALTVDPPGPDDLRPDWERTAAALEREGLPAGIPLELLRNLSDQIRAGDWRIKASVKGRDLVGLSPADSAVLGLAVDMGTTKLAGYLIDMESGRTLAAAGMMNPQIGYGEDVMSRISLAMQRDDGRSVLRVSLIDGLTELIDELCLAANRDAGQGPDGEYRPDGIVEAVLVGNTAIHHLALGLPVRQLGLAPYLAAVGSPLDLRAADLGLNLAPGASVHVPPNIAGFVGADHVAMLLGARAHQRAETTLYIDIGTNTEITLAAGGRMVCCSTASGPAFEGARIRDGMRAAEGAVERVSVHPDRIEYQTIGGLPPVGLCGSGILETVAGLKRIGLLNRTGRLDSGAPMVRQGEKAMEVVVAPREETGIGRDVVLTRADIAEIQLAKGAMRAGMEILLKHFDLTHGDLDRFVIAGAFGSYIDVQSAVDIGMFPPLDRDRFEQIGNAAGLGARLALLSRRERDQAARLARRLDYLELTGYADFQNEFAAAMMM